MSLHCIGKTLIVNCIYNCQDIEEWIKIKTPLSEIVSFDLIGKTNKVTGHEILAKALTEQLRPSKEDKEKVLLLGIDMQNDFMENGSLGVPNSHNDTKNLLKFIYENVEKITDIVLSIDTHKPQQIFHPLWWVNEQGDHPDPYTIIRKSDIDEGKWKAVYFERESADYVSKLEQLGKKQLCIWPYHCIEGTFGHSLEGQFANLVYFHSIARQSVLMNVLKGSDELTEMYGIFKPEVATKQNTNWNLLDKVTEYDKILIAGQAKSHCVLESTGQMIEHFDGDRNLTSKIFVLEDCTSSIPGFEEVTEATFKNWQKQHGINLINSTNLSL